MQEENLGQMVLASLVPSKGRRPNNFGRWHLRQKIAGGYGCNQLGRLKRARSRRE